MMKTTIRRGCAALTVAVSAVGAGVALSAADGPRAAQEQGTLDAYAAFCLPVPQAAVVAPEVPSDRTLLVHVPDENPATQILNDATSLVTQIQRGQVVELRVDATREGAVAVHGLSDIVVLGEGTAIVRFRAIYSGRFPLHFHGKDQSHFETAVLEVRS